MRYLPERWKGERWYGGKDAWRGRTHLDGKIQLTHPIRKLAGSLAKPPVLDVACGNCIDSIYFPKNYVGLDFVPISIFSAKEEFSNIQVVLGDAFRLPFRSGHFETVYSKDLIEHLPPLTYILLLREMWRVANHEILIATEDQFFAAERTNYEQQWLEPKGRWWSRYNINDLLTVFDGLGEYEYNFYKNVGAEEDRHNLYSLLQVFKK